MHPDRALTASAHSTARTSVPVHDRGDACVRTTEHDQVLLIRVLDGLDSTVACGGLDPRVADREEPEVALGRGASHLGPEHGVIEIAIERKLGAHEAATGQREEREHQGAARATHHPPSLHTIAAREVYHRASAFRPRPHTSRVSFDGATMTISAGYAQERTSRSTRV